MLHRSENSKQNYNLYTSTGAHGGHDTWLRLSYLLGARSIRAAFLVLTNLCGVFPGLIIAISSSFICAPYNLGLPGSLQRNKHNIEQSLRCSKRHYGTKKFALSNCLDL
jgi:hypothetical protein